VKPLARGGGHEGLLEHLDRLLVVVVVVVLVVSCQSLSDCPVSERVSLTQTGREKDVKAVIRQAGKSPALDFYFVSSAVNRPSSWSGGGKS
jgi:hypothetical protein